ncbi:MFS transporter [Streptomyces chartreusis]|uniref:MFS transporter n=1 Tax=Streptomyces chartreusis TaxID=1969 RepID=UPI0036828F75
MKLPVQDGTVPAPELPPRRLVPWLGALAFVINGAMSATTGVLLPNQLSAIDEAHKETNLAIVTSVAFALAVIVQPVVGTLSDVTRSRLGRRAPWMLAGAIAAAATLGLMGRLDSLLSLTACWIGVQIALNVVFAPVAAIMPDQIPAERRGRASAAIGFGFMAGATLAALMSARLADHLPVAYSALGVATLLGVGLYVVLNPDPTKPAPGTRRPNARQLLAAFWVDPRKNPDFAWAFVARFLFVISYYAVYTYSLYILTDYLGMSRDAANARIGVMSLGTVAGAIIAILIGGPLSDRIGRRKPFVYAASGFMATGFAMPLVWPTFGGVLALAVLFGVGFGLYQACDTVLMTEVLPDGGSAAAKDLGILNLANAVPQAAAPALGGVLVVATDSYGWLFGAGIVIVLLAAVAVRPIQGVR